MVGTFLTPCTARKHMIIATTIMVVVGTIGLYFLNLWVMIGYAIFAVLFWYLLIPKYQCEYCFYKIKDIQYDKWKEEYSEKWKAAWKKWVIADIIVLFFPAIGIAISFFINYSVIAFVCLIVFVGMLVGSQIHLHRDICSKCDVRTECPLKGQK